VGWIHDEREVLCGVCVEATLNSEVGTDKRMETFKSDFCGRFRARLPDSLPQVDRRRARSTPAIDKELKYNIFPMVESFKNMYMSVLIAKLTGNPTPADLINATVAKWNGLSPYEGFKAEVITTLKCPPLPTGGSCDGWTASVALLLWRPCEGRTALQECTVHPVQSCVTRTLWTACRTRTRTRA